MTVGSWTACGWLAPESPSPEPIPAVEPAPEPADVVTEDASASPPFAASHVLVAYAGAVGAGPDVTRTADEARAHAEALHGQLLDGASLAELAAAHSDDPTKSRAGYVGAFRVEAVEPAFAEAIASIEVGQLTAPFQTRYGWHVARREALTLPRARHILVSYKGARQSSELHDRTHARRMVDMLELRLTRGGDFEALAAEFSNDTTAKRGGDLGPAGEGQLLPVLEEAIAKLEPGQRTVVESVYGWHLVERTE